VRRGALVGASEALGLVGDDHVTSVHVDLASEVAAGAAGCGSHGHRLILAFEEGLARDGHGPIRWEYPSSCGEPATGSPSGDCAFAPLPRVYSVGFAGSCARRA